MVSKTIRRLSIGIGLLLLCTSALAATPQPEQYQRLNQVLIEQHILPRYRALASATAELAERTERFCGAPEESGLASVRAGFHAAADAWQAVQHLRFGPVELFLRSRRCAFWPDPRDTVGRGMAPILAEQDRQAISAESFAAGNVAIQGLPALERLLFDDGAGARLLADDAGRFHASGIDGRGRRVFDLQRLADDGGHWDNHLLALTSQP